MHENSHQYSSKVGPGWCRHCLFIFLLFASDAVAQDFVGDVPPRIELSTDKRVYRLYEPVVLRVRLTNISDRPAQLGPIRLNGTYLRFRIADPSGRDIGMYYVSGNQIVGLGVETEETATLPGQSKSADLLLSYDYPVATVVGRYTVEVGFPLELGEATTDYHRESVDFTVVGPRSPSLEAEVIQPFGAALQTLKSIAWVDATVLEAFERVLSHPGSPAYLVEAAVFYLAELDLELAEWGQDLVPKERRINLKERKPAERAAQGYADFLSRYPNSVYAQAARRGLRDARAMAESRGRRPDK